jgi:hypothetical protein
MHYTSTGNLTPNSTYTYESANGVIYRREFGSDPSKREVVGYAYDPQTEDGMPKEHQMAEDALWKDIRRTAKSNASLQEVLERAKVLYYLSKEDQHG